MDSATASPSSGSESNPSAYWKPEQPPPSTATRRVVSVGSPSASRSSFTLAAARSVIVTMQSSSYAAPARFSAPVSDASVCNTGYRGPNPATGAGFSGRPGSCLCAVL